VFERPRSTGDIFAHKGSKNPQKLFFFDYLSLLKRLIIEK